MKILYNLIIELADISKEEMGSALACCGKQEEDGSNLNTALLGKEYHSADKMRRIIRIQACFRGFMARKRVKAIRGDDGVKSMMNHFNYNGPANFENPEV
jgi:hypothetical protein